MQCVREVFRAVVLLLHAQQIEGKFVKIWSSSRSELTVNGVGAGAFDPNKMSNWQYDDRYPMIPANTGGTCNRNIYNGNVVQNGGAWNVYFGGWDGVSSCHDSVSVSVTLDKFGSFNRHTQQIATGSVVHVNNPSAIKVNDTSWAMVYTQLRGDTNLNKPGISTSKNGVNWSPASGGDAEAFIAMDGFPEWSAADVNGGNVIHYDESHDTLHLYFVNFKELGIHSVFHATANGVSNRFTYAGVALPEPQRIVNDIKLINGLHVMTFHLNGDRTFYSVSSTLDAFPESKELFSHLDLSDRYITSCGLVVDGNKLAGAIYGAGSQSSLDHNELFGVWLQRRVIFVGTDGTTWGIGAASRAHGPDVALITTNKQSLSGKFYVYDSDYVDINNRGTLLEESSVVTANQGDVWEWAPDLEQQLYT